MVKRTVNAPDMEPEEKKFDLPSLNKEHLFQIVDILEDIDPHPDIVHAKCEVVGGDEEGRSLLIRCNLDDSEKSFYFTRMLLKAIGEQYKGKEFPIDTDNWIGKQFYANVNHSKDGKYANIDQYNFAKMVDNSSVVKNNPKTVESKEIAWDD